MNKAMCCFLLVFSAAAQENQKLQFDWDKLAAKATEKADINLEGPTLDLASKFLSQSDGDAAKVQKIIQGLKGIYVKHFEFDKEGAYTEADVSAIRSQVKTPEWSNILDVKEKHESTGIFLKTDGKQGQGLVLIAAEPRELTVVQIIGPIDPSMLSDLGGKMGIPKMLMGPKSKPSPKESKPSPKDD
jgi:hypothetical protein